MVYKKRSSTNCKIVFSLYREFSFPPEWYSQSFIPSAVKDSKP